MSHLTLTITSQSVGVAGAPRFITVRGSVSLSTSAGQALKSPIRVTATFGPGGPTSSTSVAKNNWGCAAEPLAGVPPGSLVTVSVTATATLTSEVVTASASVVVPLPLPIPPLLTVDAIAAPIVADQLPKTVTFSGSSSSVQAPMMLVQYWVDGGAGAFPSAVNASGDWSRWNVTLPLPPGQHTLNVRAIDRFGTTKDITQPFEVQPQPPIVVPEGAPKTLAGGPTTSSVTSWTRLEPRNTDADMGTSSGARLFDPLWLLSRQWQMGEFQAEDAGTPVQARVRATNAMLTRCLPGELPRPAGAGPTTVAAPAYDPTRTPLEPMVERRRMRAADENETRMLSFAVESGLHFLRMVELKALSKSYRQAFITRLALAQLPPARAALVDDATARYLQSMVGRAPDGRRLAALLRTTGAAQLVLDAALAIAPADQTAVKQAATAWLAWYDTLCSEPGGPGDDAWNPARLEYALSVGARLSAAVHDDITLSATELGGPIDWANFDVVGQVSLTTAADQGVRSLVEATIPAPVGLAGMPAPRFWEMEDARIAFGLVPVGPTDLAQLMVIEYASSYGNDWFVVPLELPVGSVTRVDSLVVTDTFGVRSLLRPLGDPALPPARFSMWQSAIRSPSGDSPTIATNRFFLPPTLGRTTDGAALEDVLFMRDEMANLAWAIERSVESPIELAARRDEAPDAVPAAAPDDVLPRFQLASPVAPNWIPLLPVPGQSVSRLRRGAVLQPDGKRRLQTATGDVLNAAPDLLLYDEEVPREGVHVTSQRRLGRWSDGSTWLWTTWRNRVGSGEGSSGLSFDQIVPPSSNPA